MPVGGPDGVSEPFPLRLDMAPISLAYWAPNFVLSIVPAAGNGSYAVTTRIDFPKGWRPWTGDPRKLPFRSFVATAADCPAINAAARSLEAAMAQTQRDVFHPCAGRGCPEEFDGAGYTVQAETFGATLRASGNDASAVGVWAQRTRRELDPCWRPLS